jgi:hypothetical protein
VGGGWDGVGKVECPRNRQRSGSDLTAEQGDLTAQQRRERAESDDYLGRDWRCEQRATK